MRPLIRPQGHDKVGTSWGQVWDPPVLEHLGLLSPPPSCVWVCDLVFALLSQEPQSPGTLLPLYRTVPGLLRLWGHPTPLLEMVRSIAPGSLLVM